MSEIFATTTTAPAESNGGTRVASKVGLGFVGLVCSGRFAMLSPSAVTLRPAAFFSWRD